MPIVVTTTNQAKRSKVPLRRALAAYDIVSLAALYVLLAVGLVLA